MKQDITVVWSHQEDIYVFVGDDLLGTAESGTGHEVSTLLGFLEELENKDIQFGGIRYADVDWNQTNGIYSKLSQMPSGSVKYR